MKAYCTKMMLYCTT